MVSVSEGLHLRSKWLIWKWVDPNDEISRALQSGMSIEEAMTKYGHRLIAIEEVQGNIGLNEGIQELIRLIASTDGSPVKWDASHAYCGVGDSSTSPSATDTGLLGTNKAYKAMDSGYPTRVNQTCEWRSTFGSTEANFAWNEYTVSNSNSDAGKNLNRKVESKGTKASGETWTLSLQITIS
jgi:hypothetical protein